MVADFNKKQKGEFFTEKLLFKVVGILFLIIILILIFYNLKILSKKQEMNSLIGNLQKQIENLNQSSATLKEEIANANKPDYLEKIAYEQGMAKTGEKEIIFVSPQKKTEAISEQQDFWQMWTGWLSQSLNWIKSKF